MGEPQEISYSLAFFGTLGLIFLVFFIVVFFYKYQKKMLERQQRELEMEVRTQELLRKKEQEQQKQLLESIVEAQEKEQRRIAQDLHDEIAPVLAFIKLKAGYLQQNLQQNPELEAISQDVAHQLTGIIGRIRRISHDLLPQIVEDLGTVVAFQELAQDVSSGSGINFTFQADKMIQLGLEKKHEVTLYRVVQELVHNSLKHGKPSAINLTLCSQNKELLLTYKDNGTGFSPDELTSKPTAGKGIGLRNMQGRLDLLNGKLEISSSPGNGCIINIIVPLPTKSN